MGSLSVVGAVSPPGGDLSDPVVQSTLRIVKVFWSLEDKLAYQRHFPAISWLRSYSLYVDNITGYMKEHVAADFIAHRASAMKILQEEAALEEIVRLVGIEALSDTDRLILETAKMLREDFLHQHAFDPEDTYCSLEKQNLLMNMILNFYKARLDAVKAGGSVGEHKEIKEAVARMKYVKSAEVKEKIAALEKRIAAETAVERQ
jgi:V/A-type H+-transporting ATPase subunit A